MFNKLFKDEGGFTLIELLVTIAILGVLFGIVTLTLSGVGADAQGDVCSAEFHVVQSAIDIYLAGHPSATFTGGTNIQISNGDDNFGDYLQGTTVGSYTWTTAGVLSWGTTGACSTYAP